jgi:hypothetical protein
MATYYKYAERNADSQVNWAEVGKGISDMLKQETTIREQKKAAIDQATREFQQTLENAPQGQFQDANKFTNDYAHSMMEQQMIDNRLLKSGQMKLQDFTFRRQNYVDGTNTLFDLQKLYQENYKKKMEGIQSGELQALTGANMASVEGFADFSKSKAVIDPTTGVVNVGIMRPNPTTGVLELTNDVAPVNVIKGKILADIPAFKVEEAMNNTVKNLGESMDYIYQAATKTGAGTVTKLLGIGALQGEVKKHPEFQDSIDKANAAINSTIDSYFANDYNISSVLTQNTGKYSQESFTYDKDVAAKDKSKILLKINTSTGLPIIDKSGAHYKEQEKEARDWVRTQLLGKIDDKRQVDVTGTIPYGPQAQAWQYAAGQQAKDEQAAAGAWNQLYTGKTAAAKRDAADILLGTPNAQAQGLLGIDLETKPGTVILTYADPKKNREIPMAGSTLFDFAGKGVELHGVVDRQKAVKAGGGGTTYGAITDFSGVRSSRAGVQGAEDYTPKVAQIAAGVENLIVPDDPKATQNNLINKFRNLGFSFRGYTNGFTDDMVDVTDATGKVIGSFNIDNKDDAAAIEDLIIKRFDRKAAANVFGAQKGKPTVTGGNVR